MVIRRDCCYDVQLLDSIGALLKIGAVIDQVIWFCRQLGISLGIPD